MERLVSMRTWLGLALASIGLMANSTWGNYASRVEAYDPGTGFATTFSGAGYTNASAAVGEPNRQTSFGEVQPFNPPFDVTEIVSMGTNGFIVLRLAAPIRNDARHPYGLDFIIHGSAGFIDIDYPFGLTDGSGSMFGQGTGTTRISVSADNQVFYTLNPALAPPVDRLYPTDSEGTFGVPVNPGLQQSDFGNKTLEEIRALYAGSAGGAGYDLAWAHDSNGVPVTLEAVRFVRIDVLDGRAEIDGIVAPDPGTTTLVEDFAQTPASRGWRVFGNPALFQWNADLEQMDVTWDSRVTNSYFYHPLGTVLTKADDFSCEFDLRLRDIQIGVTPGRPYTFEIAIGFIHLASATGTNFFRGIFSGTRNIVEFDYFPEFSSFGATVGLTMVSTNGSFAYSHNFPLELPLDETLHVTMSYTATNGTLKTTMTRDDGSTFAPLQDVVLGPAFADFRCDALAISSYSDARADGSVLAHGVVDNLQFTVPEPPIQSVRGGFIAGAWEVTFDSVTSWSYQLERSTDLRTWTAVGPSANGTGGTLTLADEAGADKAFYRVIAERP